MIIIIFSKWLYGDQLDIEENSMQLTHGEGHRSINEITSIGASATLNAAMKAWAGLGSLISLFLASLNKFGMKWAGLGILILLFLASLAYVGVGGTFALKASPIPESETSIAAVTVERVAASGAPIEQRVSGSSATPSYYFPAAYPNRGRDGDANVMTYEHD